MVRKAKRLATHQNTVENIVCHRKLSLNTFNQNISNAKRSLEVLEENPNNEPDASTQFELSQLVAQCEALANRVKAIEQKYLKMDTKTSISESYCTMITEAIHFKTEDDKKKESREDLAADMRLSINELGNTVSKLDHVFLDLASLHERREAAAFRIQKHVRGFLTRKSYIKYLGALSTWRKKYADDFIGAIERFKAKQTLLDERVAQLQHEKRTRQFRAILLNWRSITEKNLPFVITRRNAADKRFNVAQERFHRHLLNSWLKTAKGPRSRKTLQFNYQMRFLKAREHLESMQRFHVITSDMVHEEISKQIVRTIRKRHQYHTLNMFWNAIYKDIYLVRIETYHVADRHCRKTRLTKTFRGWEAFYNMKKAVRDTGMGNIVRRQAGWEKFKGVHNLGKIDHFARTNAMKAHFLAWKNHCARYRMVRQKFEKALRRNMLHILRSMQIQAKYQIRLRALVIKEWRNHTNRVYHVPFRAWFIYATERRARHQAQNTLIYAYRRKQSRQIIYTAFHSWNHQAKYGQIEGIHSKIELIKTLEDQKIYAQSLETTCERYQFTLDELSGQINQEKEWAIEQQKKYEQQVEVDQQNRFALHNIQQQLAILYSMLDSVAEIHPTTVARVKKHLQNETRLDFKDDIFNLAKEHNNMMGIDPQEIAKTLQKTALDSSDDEEEDAKKNEKTREEGLLLKRLKWVLSRMDLRGGADGNESQHLEQQELDNLSTEAEQMYALFEFIRSGDTGPLLPENRPDQHEALNLRKHSCYRKSSTKFLQRSKQSGKALVEPEKPIVSGKIDLIETQKTWGDFVSLAATKFPPRKTISVRERLLRRVSHNDTEAPPSALVSASGRRLSRFLDHPN